MMAANHPAWQRILDRVTARDAGGSKADPVAALTRDLTTLREVSVSRSTQTQVRDDCIAHAAEWVARAFHADTKFKLESLPPLQQAQCVSGVEAILECLMREAVERA